jgi:hypothetical protein
MSWYPDAKYHNVDGGDKQSCAPFHSGNQLSVIGHHMDTIDDDLHQQLDLKYPEEEQCEQHRDPRKG